ncbi:MAG TPA: universal stress protein [Amycolatopsis sp.]|nr:universal stress protein [Amycolatopsis sp.]
MSGTVTRPVVVGMNGSHKSLGALRWAAKEAVVRDTTLVLFQACLFETPGHDGSEDAELLLEHVYRWNRHAAGFARSIAPGVEVEVKIRLGLAPDLLLAESVLASLLVLGARGHGRVREAAVTSAVVAKARCPVVVVRGRYGARGSVVVGVSASSSSEQALRFALDAAAVRGAPTHVVHVWHDATFLRFGTRASAERRSLEDRVAGWARKYPGLRITAEALRDRKPSHALTRAVPDALMIVIGSSGRGAVGSTGSDLLAQANCPVVVVH